MTVKEADAEIDLINKETAKQKIAVIQRYYEANFPYRVGDIFTDHMKLLFV